MTDSAYISPDEHAVTHAGDLLPVAPPTVFKGWPVVAAIRLAEDPTLKPRRHVIVARHPQVRGEPARYSVHTVGWNPPIGIWGGWTAGEGKYGLKWVDAIRVMYENAAAEAPPRS
jgi:hypothetical protein